MSEEKEARWTTPMKWKEDYKTRTIEEAEQLMERIVLLNEFIKMMHTRQFDDLSEKEQNLMTLQYAYMEQYHEILCERIRRM